MRGFRSRFIWRWMGVCVLLSSRESLETRHFRVAPRLRSLLRIVKNLVAGRELPADAALAQHALPFFPDRPAASPSKLPAAKGAVRLADPFSELDEKLQRRSDRLLHRLKAWGELLDVAGWCVALEGRDGGVWLSQRAQKYFRGGGGTPETWSDLLQARSGIETESIQLHQDGVLVWSGESTEGSERESAANLTPREAVVMSWLQQGKTDPEIAIILGSATRTVEKHVANLYRKLGVKSRAGAILNGTGS